MRSRFSFWPYFIAFYAFIFTLIVLFCIFADVFYRNVVPIYFYVITNICVAFVWTWVVLGELRNKVIVLEIAYDHLIISRYLGIAPAQTVYFDQVEGFKISILPARGNAYEFLYIMSGGKKVAKLSEFYHRNYQELKEALSQQFKDLGFEEYSYVREVKEIFV